MYRWGWLVGMVLLGLVMVCGQIEVIEDDMVDIGIIMETIVLCNLCVEFLVCVINVDVNVCCVLYGDFGSFCGQSCEVNGDCFDGIIC